jgi:hypothetical protein
LMASKEDFKILDAEGINLLEQVVSLLQ